MFYLNTENGFKPGGTGIQVTCMNKGDIDTEDGMIKLHDEIQLTFGISNKSHKKKPLVIVQMIRVLKS